MRPEIHNILISADEKDNWEYPKKFRWDKRIKLIQEFKNDFESVFKIELDIDKNVQDASFTTDLGLLDEKLYDRKTGTGALRYIFSFRFSNFGNLFTILNMPEKNDEYYTEILTCRKIIEDSQFVFIDLSELDEIYDGVNEPYENGLTWWTRFFDYL
ncbi:hypothetical protein [Tenacibaculum halocynthiae]|uniref:hypothetical protein n=1 Tax=Tenacibaculum halocynthiae TaxID=1254437 RepID=UPI003D65B4E0